MAQYTGSITVSNADDTAFRAWVNAIHDAIIGSGFAEATSDTGQADLATITRPASTGFGGYYRMYQLTDGVTHTGGYRPLMKFEFGRNGLTTPRMQFTFGGATDGAGTFVGQSWSPGTSENTRSTETIKASGISGGGGFWVQIGTYMLIGLEHGWNTDGTVTEPFAQCYRLQWGNGSVQSRYFRLDGADAFKAFNYVMHDAYIGSLIGSQYFAHPVRMAYGSSRPPSKMLLVIDPSELGADAVVSDLTHYGVAGDYWRSNLQGAPAQFTSNPSYPYAWLLRWEA